MAKRMTDKEFAAYIQTISGPNATTHLETSNWGDTACGDKTPGRQQSPAIERVTCVACLAIANGTEG
jgi:hypothetical protein